MGDYQQDSDAFTIGELEMANQSESQLTVTIEKWLTDGWQLYKQRRFTYFFASLIAAFICIPPLFIFFAAPLYAGLYYMALKSMRREDVRIRDIFRGFDRYWGAFFLWLVFPVGGTILLVATVVGILFVPLLWAMSMLAFPLLIDQKLSVGDAFSMAFKKVASWRNFRGFWLYGLALTFISVIGLLGFVFGVFITIPFVVCTQVIAYRDLFKPEEAFQAEAADPWHEYPFQLKARYIGPISRIRELRNRIFEEIDSASTSIKPLLDPSTEHLNSVFTKAADLIQRLQNIESYLQTADRRSLDAEKDEIQAKIATAANPRVALQYEEALRMVEERIDTHENLESLASQIHAQLTTIRVSLDNTLAKIIRIKTTEISNARFESDDVSKALRNLRIEMDALLESLNEMVETHA
jgi:hypothetical protein